MRAPTFLLTLWDPVLPPPFILLLPGDIHAFPAPSLSHLVTFSKSICGMCLNTSGGREEGEAGIPHASLRAGEGFLYQNMT